MGITRPFLHSLQQFQLLFSPVKEPTMQSKPSVASAGAARAMITLYALFCRPVASFPFPTTIGIMPVVVSCVCTYEKTRDSTALGLAKKTSIERMKKHTSVVVNVKLIFLICMALLANIEVF
jgi:hypothetical protein